MQQHEQAQRINAIDRALRLGHIDHAEHERQQRAIFGELYGTCDVCGEPMQFTYFRANICASIDCYRRVSQLVKL